MNQNLIQYPFSTISGCGNDRFGGCGSVLPCHICINPADWKYTSVTSFISTPNDTLEAVSQKSESADKADMNLSHISGTMTDTVTDAVGMHVKRDDNSLSSTQHDTSQSFISTIVPVDPSRIQFLYIQGCLRDRAVGVLQRFYSRGNPKAPDNKRERPLQSSE